MNYYIYDFNNEFDFEKIIIGKKVTQTFDNLEDTNKNIFKYYIYYLDVIPKDLYINLPSIRIIYNYKNNKFNQINLPIYPLYDKTKELILFLKKLKNKIIETIINENKDFYNFLEKKDKLYILKFKINNENLFDLKINSEIKGLINISHIWENQNKFGLSLYSSKLILNPKIDINFLDDEKKLISYEKESFSTNEIIKSSNINKIIKSSNTSEFNVPLNKSNSSLFKISPNLLLEAKNKLIKRTDD
jgi:hypothetical protein